MGWRLDVGSADNSSGTVEDRSIGIISADTQRIEASGVRHQISASIRAHRPTGDVSHTRAGGDTQAAAQRRLTRKRHDEGDPDDDFIAGLYVTEL